MAITLQQTPGNFAPVYNPLIYVATSDNTNESNFNFVFDVYIGGSLFSRHKVPARPGTTEAVFDVSGIIRDQVTHDIDIDTDTPAINENSYIKYSVNIGEEYDVSGTSTLFSDLDIGADFYAINSALKYRDFVNFSNGDFLLAASSDRFLTNAPSTQKMFSGQHAWLYTINDDPTVVARMQVVQYDSSDNVLSTDNISNTNTADNDDNRFLRFAVGHQNLSDQLASFPDADLSYYTVEVQTSGGASLSEMIRYDLKEECRYTPFKIHFLNRLGGFDHFVFNKRSDENLEVLSRISYKGSVGTLSGTTYSFSEDERHETTQQVLSQDSVSVFSDILSDDEFTWLEELITSPVVFHESTGGDGNPILLPVIIENRNYNKLKRVNSQVEPLRIDFKYTVVEAAQIY